MQFRTVYTIELERTLNDLPWRRFALFDCFWVKFLSSAYVRMSVCSDICPHFYKGLSSLHAHAVWCRPSKFGVIIKHGEAIVGLSAFGNQGRVATVTAPRCGELAYGYLVLMQYNGRMYGKRWLVVSSLQSSNRLLLTHCRCFHFA